MADDHRAASSAGRGKQLPSSFRERSLRNPITEIRRAKFGHVTIANIAHKRLGSSAGVLTNHIRTGLNECVFEFQPGERPKNFIVISLHYKGEIGAEHARSCSPAYQRDFRPLELSDSRSVHGNSIPDDCRFL